MLESTLAARHDPEGLVAEYVRTQKAELKDLIIIQYSGMVERIARRFSGVELVDDLTQVGFIGLLNALSKFDPNAGVRFNTYATHLVTGEIRHYLRDRSQTIRHPAWLQELRHKIQKAAARLQGELGRPPTQEEIAAAAQIPEDTVREAMAAGELLKVASLDAAAYEDEDGESDVDRLDSGLVDNEAISMEQKMVLHHAISQLRDLEQEVLVLFHFEALNQTEIAQKLDISCNYVSHILRQCHSKLRRILSQDDQAEIAVQDSRVLDSATGLYSEAYFRSRLNEEVHRAMAEKGCVALILFELTGMAAYRQFYGVQSATELLADLGDLLKSSVRGLDIVCRFGGSGFAAILPATGASALVARERLEGRARHWLVGRIGAGGSMRVLVGHGSCPNDCSSAADLVEFARPPRESDLPRAA